MSMVARFEEAHGCLHFLEGVLSPLDGKGMNWEVDSVPMGLREIRVERVILNLEQMAGRTRLSIAVNASKATKYAHILSR